VEHEPRGTPYAPPDRRTCTPSRRLTSATFQGLASGKEVIDAR
jgi:hypothetical protein